jgi:hypothetical protein
MECLWLEGFSTLDGTTVTECGCFVPPATSVMESATLGELRDHLERVEAVDAVILSEDTPHTIEQAAAIVRTRSVAPMILFRRSMRPLDENAFEHVFAWSVPPAEWLDKMAELIAQSHVLQERQSPAGIAGSASPTESKLAI